MPELPEVEVITRQFRSELLGAKTVACKFYRESLRLPIPTAEFHSIAIQHEILQVFRRGKYMLVGTEKGFLLFHFGMSGRLLALPTAAPKLPHTHLIWTLKKPEGQVTYLHYVDPRRFGVIVTVAGEGWESHPTVRDLGVEPLETKRLGNYLYKASRGRRVPIKSFVMDAKVVVGVGNIYACEALLGSGIHPLKPAMDLSQSEYQKLAKEICITLDSAIAQGGTSFRDYEHLSGEKGYFKVQLNSYGREECGRCGRTLETFKIAGRTTWVCPRCQPA